MTLNKNQILVCTGQMPLRAPDGKQLAAVPVYKIISAKAVNTDPVAELAPNERLTFIGTMESKASAEERYKALKEGETPSKSHATPLYIKDTADSADTVAELTEGEKRALNPLISDLLKEFSAAMSEREALKQ